MQIYFEIFGAILVFAGLAIRLHCVFVNPSFALHLEVPADLCGRGLYRIVRHPAYLGSLLAVFGAALLLTEIANALLFGFLAYLFFADRALREERLILNFYPAYAEYQKETGFLLPKLWKVI